MKPAMERLSDERILAITRILKRSGINISIIKQWLGNLEQLAAAANTDPQTIMDRLTK